MSNPISAQLQAELLAADTAWGDACEAVVSAHKAWQAKRVEVYESLGIDLKEFFAEYGFTYVQHRLGTDEEPWQHGGPEYPAVRLLVEIETPARLVSLSALAELIGSLVSALTELIESLAPGLEMEVDIVYGQQD